MSSYSPKKVVPIPRTEWERHALSVFLNEKAFLFGLLDKTLFDAGFLAGEVAEIIKLRTTHLAILVDSDRLNERRFDRENPLHADSVGHLTDSEAFLVFAAVDTDNNAAILLDTLFVALLDTIGHCNGVAGATFIKLLFGSGKCLLHDLDLIHCYVGV